MKTFREAEEVLAESLPNYAHRPQQAELAEAIEKALENGEHLLADAPVGVGKSMAALIPAILSGKRVIIATATNVLANQYYEHDLPFLKKHLPVDFSYEMIVGKSNYACFQGDTQVLTKDGLRPIRELAEKGSAYVLDGNAKWVKSPIRSFGDQPLMRVNLSRGVEKKSIYATPEHRWLTTEKADSSRANSVEITTENLSTGDFLTFCAPRSRVRNGREVAPSTFGIAHGITFGDGTLFGENSPGSGRRGVITLYGEKNFDLLPYFNGSKTNRVTLGDRYKDDYAVRVENLPTFFKKLPSLSENLSYLYGWLAGYFAADGSVGSGSEAAIHSASRNNLEFVGRVCTKLGIQHGRIKTTVRKGLEDRDNSSIYSISLTPASLTDDFFLIREHRRKVEEYRASRTHRQDRATRRWKVVSVENTDLVEEVFCAVVPTTSSFVIEDYILTGNCNAEMEANKDKTPFVARVREELAAHPGHSGNLDRFTFSIPNDDRKYLSISSTECPGLKNCQVGRELGCFPIRARDRAQDAQILVTNISALVLNAKLDGYFLGEYDALIIDEGHELDAYALSSLASTVNFHSVRTLAEKSLEYLPNASEPHEVIEGINYVEDIMEIMMEGHDFLKIDHDLMIEMVDEWMPIFGGITFIKNVTGDIARRNNERVEENPQDVISGENARKASKLSRQAENLQETLENLILGEGNYVRWLEKNETRGRDGRTNIRTDIRLSPIESAPYLRHILWDGNEEAEVMPPVIVMSGTLASNGNFNFVKRTLGAWSAGEVQVESPFDYESQSRLFIPNRSVPAPNQFDEWKAWYLMNVSEMIAASRGGALLLFTSRRAMEAVHEEMRPFLASKGYRSLIQDGQTSNNELGRVFNEDNSSVLFGLKSFFQGFDPKSDACRLVVLDKLPFPVPTDIIFEARANIVEGNGESSFSSLSIPMLTVTLRQAMGRLIRSNRHRGVMAVMDSRLSSKRYGNMIVSSLPPSPRIDRVSQAADFLLNT